nr:secondary metabolism regulator laea [Quercus suber]
MGTDQLMFRAGGWGHWSLRRVHHSIICVSSYESQSHSHTTLSVSKMGVEEVDKVDCTIQAMVNVPFCALAGVGLEYRNTAEVPVYTAEFSNPPELCHAANTEGEVSTLWLAVLAVMGASSPDLVCMKHATLRHIVTKRSWSWGKTTSRISISEFGYPRLSESGTSVIVSRIPRLSTMAKEDVYPLPRATGEKAEETKRLEEQHELFKLVLGGLAVAPLPANISSVLDVGCGTGIWTCQFAALHPTAQVLGVDILPPVASSSSNRVAPKNCNFVQANIEEDWAFASGQRFDFIFERLLILALRDWPRLFRQVYQHLQPGGLFETYEAPVAMYSEDGATSADSAAMRWWDQVHRYLSSHGLDPDTPAKFPAILRDIGFEIIYDQPVRLYLDPGRGAAHNPATGAQVATQFSRDVRDLIHNVTQKMFPSAAHRALAAEAIEDMAQNSARRGTRAKKVIRRAIIQRHETRRVRGVSSQGHDAAAEGLASERVRFVMDISDLVSRGCEFFLGSMRRLGSVTL